MDEIVIRMAKPEETGILAEIERICFPPQEAASPKQVEERMRTFPENFVVAEADGSQSPYFSWRLSDGFRTECAAGLPAPGGRRKAGGIFYRSGSKEGKERRDPNL